MAYRTRSASSIATTFSSHNLSFVPFLLSSKRINPFKRIAIPDLITRCIFFGKMLWFNAVLLIFATLTSTVDAANPKKPHGHNGTLAHYDGKPLPFKVTGEQNKKLEQGQPVRTTCCRTYHRLDLFESYSQRSSSQYRLPGTKRELASLERVSFCKIFMRVQRFV